VFALFAGTGASMVSMWSLGWTSDRLGRKAYPIAVDCVFGLGISGLTLAANFAALVAAFVVLYAGTGFYDLGINAVDLERSSGRRLMLFLHTLYAFGAVFGSLGAGALLSAGVDLRLFYLALLVPLAAVAVGVVFTCFPNPVGVRAGSSSEGFEEDGASRWGLYRVVVASDLAVLALSRHHEKGGRWG
jgi:MFS family permease